MDFNKIKIGFLSMEIGIDAEIPTYAGGLGILAGDALRSCADMNLPIAGVTLLYKKGYFKQRIDSEGNQAYEEQDWDPYAKLKKLDSKVTIKISGEDVKIGCWMYEIKGQKTVNPILFLDTDLEENPEHWRATTHKLYQGDKRHRLAQELILGIGGVKMLKELGCDIKKYHLNEGHTTFATLALCRECECPDVLDEIRKKCVFTTHTPVEAGHDKFEQKVVEEMAAEYLPKKDFITIFKDGQLNMTTLGLKFSGYINGVARKHSKVSGKMFGNYEIHSVTNGVHTEFWMSKPFQELFDEKMPEWRTDSYSLRSAMNLLEKDVWEAHIQAKKELLNEIKERTGKIFDERRFTIGFARRFVEYKRPGIILSDLERLKSIAEEKGDIQIVFAGKAHPGDEKGKLLIKKTIEKMNRINTDKIQAVFLENYNIKLAKMMIAGCDIWLNNPRRPYEASGTSGMKAAINGVPHFSTLDGWWLEGHIEGVTGWSIGLHPNDPYFDEDVSPDDEAEDLYTKLKEVVIPIFYGNREKWQNIMKSCIAINASFFNTQRMMQQYALDAYYH